MNQVEEHTTHNALEFHQYSDHARNINIRQSVSGILHTLIDIYVLFKVHIQPAISYDSTDGNIYTCIKLPRKLRLSGDTYNP